MCSVGFRGSLGMEGYMGKYSRCGYIQILTKDGLSSMGEKKSLSLRESYETMEILLILTPSLLNILCWITLCTFGNI